VLKRLNPITEDEKQIPITCELEIFLQTIRCLYTRNGTLPDQWKTKTVVYSTTKDILGRWRWCFQDYFQSSWYDQTHRKYISGRNTLSLLPKSPLPLIHWKLWKLQVGLQFHLKPPLFYIRTLKLLCWLPVS